MAQLCWRSLGTEGQETSVQVELNEYSTVRVHNVQVDAMRVPMATDSPHSLVFTSAEGRCSGTEQHMY